MAWFDPVGSEPYNWATGVNGMELRALIKFIEAFAIGTAFFGLVWRSGRELGG